MDWARRVEQLLRGLLVMRSGCELGAVGQGCGWTAYLEIDCAGDPLRITIV